MTLPSNLEADIRAEMQKATGGVLALVEQALTAEPPAWTPGSVPLRWADGGGDLPEPESPGLMSAEAIVASTGQVIPADTRIRVWAYSETGKTNIEIDPDTQADLPAGRYLVLAQVVAGDLFDADVTDITRESAEGQPSRRLRRWLYVPAPTDDEGGTDTPPEPEYPKPLRPPRSDLRIIYGEQFLTERDRTRENVIIDAQGKSNGVTVMADDCALLGTVWVENTGPYDGDLLGGSGGVILHENRRNFRWEHGGTRDIRGSMDRRNGRATPLYADGSIDMRLGDLTFLDTGTDGDTSLFPNQRLNEFTQGGPYLLNAKGLRAGVLACFGSRGGNLKLSSDGENQFSDAEIAAIVAIGGENVVSFSTTSNGRAGIGDHQNVIIRFAVGHQIGGPLATQNDAIVAWGVMADGAAPNCQIDHFILGATAVTFASRRPVEANGVEPQITVYNADPYGWRNPAADSPWSISNEAIYAKLAAEGAGPWLLEALK